MKAGWDLKRQVSEEVYLTDGRIFVTGSATSRGERKRADILLYRKPNLPIAVIEELAAKGIVREDLRDERKRNLDLFDLVCHVACGRPALTRRERVEDVKKRK